MYYAASFHGQPSLDQVVKLTPRNCAAEEGVPGSSIVAERNDVGEDEDHPVRVNRKGISQGGTSISGTTNMTAALAPIAEAITRPVQLVLIETSPKRRKHSQTVGRLERNALARDYASTLTSLMELESNAENGSRNHWTITKTSK
jgi:hypothetical protein